MLAETAQPTSGAEVTAAHLPATGGRPLQGLHDEELHRSHHPPVQAQELAYLVSASEEKRSGLGPSKPCYRAAKWTSGVASTMAKASSGGSSPGTLQIIEASLTNPKIAKGRSRCFGPKDNMAVQHMGGNCCRDLAMQLSMPFGHEMRKTVV